MVHVFGGFSSLWEHAGLLCWVPVLSYVPSKEVLYTSKLGKCADFLPQVALLLNSQTNKHISKQTVEHNQHFPLDRRSLSVCSLMQDIAGIRAAGRIHLRKH